MARAWARTPSRSASRTPRTSEPRAEAGATTPATAGPVADAFTVAVDMSMGPSMLIVLAALMPSRPTSPPATTEVTSRLVAPDLHECLLDALHGVRSCGFAGLVLTILGHTCHYTFTCNNTCK
ncbi:hypothetical protein ABMA10_06000 [Plantibacter sp. RU18]